LATFNVSWSLGKGAGLLLGGLLTESIGARAALLVGAVPALMAAFALPIGSEPARGSGEPARPVDPGRLVPLPIAWMTNALAFGLVGVVNVHAPPFLLHRGSGAADFGLLTGSIFAVQTVTFLVTGDWALSEEGGLPFALYAGKELSAAQKYPLVLALHGKSQNNENGKQVGGFIKSFAKPDNYAARPCIIVAPLCYQPYGGGGGGWSDKPGTQTVDLLKKLIKSLPVDDKRIYVVGYSMGGFGTCHLMNTEQRLFTAGVAIAGCTGTSTADSFKRKPLWLFHAADDAVVPVSYSRDLAKALERSKTFKYTEYPDGGHGIPGKVFDNPEVHTWLFSQVE
jgi:dienelactone hydrolase